MSFRIQDSLNSFIPNWSGPWPPWWLIAITLILTGCTKLHVALQTCQGLPQGLCSCRYLCVEYFSPGHHYDLFLHSALRFLLKENSVTTLSEITAPSPNILIPNFLTPFNFIFVEFVVSEKYISKNFLPNTLSINTWVQTMPVLSTDVTMKLKPSPGTY